METEIKGDINPALRNFFFFSLKSQKNFKQGEKEIGKIKTVSFIITEQETKMESESVPDKDGLTKKVKTILTDEEKYKLLKIFGVKRESVDECKSVFVILNMDTKTAFIRKKKKTGEIENITI